MEMQINKIIWWNLGLIISIGVYGALTDEPYWREFGHDPNLYDYLFWFATALNGPSSVAADYLSWLAGTHARFIHWEWQAEARFMIQYVLWCLLLWPQWKLYEFVANFSLQNRQRRVVLSLFALLFILAGGIATHKAWLFGHWEAANSDLFINKYFWFWRIGGLACSGLVFSVYAYLTMRHRMRAAGRPIQI